MRTFSSCPTGNIGPNLTSSGAWTVAVGRSEPLQYLREGTTWSGFLVLLGNPLISVANCLFVCYSWQNRISFFSLSSNHPNLLIFLFSIILNCGKMHIAQHCPSTPFLSVQYRDIKHIHLCNRHHHPSPERFHFLN